jgi:hypothetical protein
MDLSTIINEICQKVELDVDAVILIREEYSFESITRSKELILHSTV